MKRESVLFYFQKAAHFLPLLLFGLALFLVHSELKTHPIDHIIQSVKGVPAGMLSAAALLTVLNYLVLAGYDLLALRYTGHGRIPVSRILTASLISYAISNNTGHAWAAGGSVRYRFYSAWGIPGWDVLKISLFLTVTYFLGILTLGYFSSLLLPKYLLHPMNNPQMIHGLTAICTLCLGGYWAAVIFWRKPLIIKGLELRLPSVIMTCGQTVIAAIDVILSSLVLWVFLSNRVEFSFTAFLLVFVLAQAAGVVSQIPGGIGVFESTFLWLMSAVQSTHQHHHLSLIGALFLYRTIYYFLPLMLAGAGLLSYEAFARRKALFEGSRALRRMLSVIIPQIYSVLLLFSGAALLVSGAIPANPSAANWLRGFIPLPVIEISHLLGSLTGLLLLFLARGIRLRIDAAWYGSLILLAMGIPVSMIKGNWLASLVIFLMLMLMLPAKSYFRRKSSLFDMPFSRPWIAMIGIVLAGSTWLGFFAYRNIQYANELWWQFSYMDDAPRFLRALLLSAVFTTGYALYQLLAVAHPRALKIPDSAELDDAAALMADSADTRGFLALLGDKYLCWSSDRKAFLMFAVTPKYWIVMGDPVGEPKAVDSLLWRFREEVDHYNAKSVFYQVSDKYLPYYLDLGLSLLKIGEEARVDLAKFTLQGSKRDSQRGARNKFTKKGYRFAILDKEALKNNLAVLRSISDRWLLKKRTREKGFSLGFFNEAYICRTVVAVIFDPFGRIRAFANLWKNVRKEELSVDLMRYDPESPSGIMEYLFVELMLWGKTESYQWFSLGMAPLAGLERHPLAPLWHKIGTAIFDLGEEFYNFEGLYAYKAKFEPEWLPRYLAAPAGLSVPFILMTVTRLISGGWKGVLSR